MATRRAGVREVTPAGPAPPPTSARPVTESLHGVEVVDPYRWLEDGDAVEVRAWTAAQNAYTESWLVGVPVRHPIRARQSS